jgi:hypothetical protein
MLPWHTNIAPTAKESYFPVNGVSYRDSLLLLINLIWMLGMTAIWPAQDEQEQDFRKDKILILVALNPLHSVLCKVGSQGQSHEQRRHQTPVVVPNADGHRQYFWLFYLGHPPL